MDLNKNSLLFSRDGEFTKHDNIGDTTLCLNGPGFGGNNLSRFGCKTNLGASLFNAPDDGCRLVLGLGPTPSAYSNEYHSFSMKRSSKGPFSEGDSILQLGLSGGTIEASSISVSSEAEIVNTSCTPGQVSPRNTQFLVQVVDEGSTSAKKSGGYMPSLLLAPRMDGSSSTISFRTKSQPSESSLSRGEYLVETTTAATSEQETAETPNNNPKKCRFMGCTKGARGASGLCIGHGGGQRCQKPGCNKGAESRAAYCKSHGGGRRCQHLGCTKSAEGRTEHCIAHGGGRRCGHESCTKAARGKSGLCIRHGGGKRCQVEGCTRSAEGQAGLCISHGGGRRCRFEGGCTKGAQGSTAFCKAHGGGRRCVFQGCTKGAEGSTPLCKAHGGGKRCLFDGGGICPKSVHGGTSFCVAHGGGKRCAVPGCTKSARGRTDCCVRHGGGKRCRVAGCDKSAQGSTDFCKAHGGGKRCCWPDGKCEKFARGKSGLCAAHSSAMQGRESGRAGSGLIGPRLFHGLVSAASGVTSAVSDGVDSPAAKRRQLIPAQVLVPLSMKSSAGSLGSSPGFDVVPEGRVHGGPLMSLFGGNLRNAIDGV